MEAQQQAAAPKRQAEESRQTGADGKHALVIGRVGSLGWDTRADVLFERARAVLPEARVRRPRHHDARQDEDSLCRQHPCPGGRQVESGVPRCEESACAASPTSVKTLCNGVFGGLRRVWSRPRADEFGEVQGVLVRCDGPVLAYACAGTLAPIGRGVAHVAAWWGPAAALCIEGDGP